MYKAGDYFVICDRCGFKRYASECKKEWNGSFVCADTCYEEKHPHSIPPKPLHEKQKVPIHRPEQADTFITTPITADDL